MILSIQNKYLKSKKEKNLKFPQEWHKDESIETLSPAIHLEWWDRHFEHKYLDCNNIQKQGERENVQKYQYDKGKGVKKETIYFNF